MASMTGDEPANSKLEAQTLAQFDALVEKGEIFWSPTEEIRTEQDPFDIYFRVSPITASKPYNPSSKSRKPGFQDDDPDFTLCTIGHDHKLILNKFCWLRPQLILHTLKFQSQRDLLTLPDFEATWEVLEVMGDRYMVVFNGGPNAGSSVAHKHLQIFPRPEWKTFPDRIAEGSWDSELPFVYEQMNLSDHTSPTDVHTHYRAMTNKLSIQNDVAHSVLLTRSWIAVMPRACATIDGEIADAPMQGGANAMIGMEWLKSVQQFENWKTYGPMKVLEAFGVTPDHQTSKGMGGSASQKDVTA